MRFPILLALLISGCTSIVPMTAMRLSGLSPTTADPADLAVDLALPEGIDVSPGTAVLTFSVARSDLNQTEKKDFILQRDGTVFTINPADYDALRALQATSRQWKAENGDATQGSLGVTLVPCRLGIGPAQDAVVSVGIRMEQNGAFLPLVRNGPLSAVTTPDLLRVMKDCPIGQ